MSNVDAGNLLRINCIYLLLALINIDSNMKHNNKSI
jgi:hypothetical protein